MNTLLPFLTIITMAAALPAEENWGSQAYEPATIISEGPWVEESLWDNRDPKGIMDSLPSPTKALAQLGSWWSWDR